MPYNFAFTHEPTGNAALDAQLTKAARIISRGLNVDLEKASKRYSQNQRDAVWTFEYDLGDQYKLGVRAEANASGFVLIGSAVTPDGQKTPVSVTIAPPEVGTADGKSINLKPFVIFSKTRNKAFNKQVDNLTNTMSQILLRGIVTAVETSAGPKSPVKLVNDLEDGFRLHIEVTFPARDGGIGFRFTAAQNDGPSFDVPAAIHVKNLMKAVSPFMLRGMTTSPTRH